MILQNEQNIEGRIEKIHENSINCKIEYIGKDRIRIHVTEKGTQRESTLYYELKKECGDTLAGTFDSTAANSSGTVICRRIPFA